MSSISIWPGSSSFFPGDTPFGFYDNDRQFQYDADLVADWCARRLGYPIVDVELRDVQFFAAFEEAITEYGSQVNTYVSKDNMLYLLGVNTGSINLAGQYVSPSANPLVNLSKDYGTMVGVRGNITYYTGSIELQVNKQIYDFKTDATVRLESGSFGTDTFTIRRIHHYAPPAMVRYLDPYVGTGMGSQNLLEGFGWSSYSPAVSFTLYPTNYDLLKVQAIEMSDQIRKSHYSFELINNRLKIFPIPTRRRKLYFEYTLDKDVKAILKDGTGNISDHSNIPYGNMVYSRINQIGRQWIRRYALALSKEMLGYVRGKYDSMPVPDGEVALNGDSLLTAAEAEKSSLIEELKETLDQFSRQNLLERKNAESIAISEQLSKIPLGYYVG